MKNRSKRLIQSNILEIISLCNGYHCCAFIFYLSNFYTEVNFSVNVKFIQADSIIETQSVSFFCTFSINIKREVFCCTIFLSIDLNNVAPIKIVSLLTGSPIWEVLSV